MGQFTGSPPDFIGKTMVSCRCSQKPQSFRCSEDLLTIQSPCKPWVGQRIKADALRWKMALCLWTRQGPGVSSTKMGPTTRLGLMFDRGQILGAIIDPETGHFCGDLIHQRPSPGSLVAASAVPSSRSMMGMVGGQWSSPEGRCGMVGISWWRGSLTHPFFSSFFLEKSRLFWGDVLLSYLVVLIPLFRVMLEAATRSTLSHGSYTKTCTRTRKRTHLGFKHCNATGR